MNFRALFCKHPWWFIERSCSIRPGDINSGDWRMSRCRDCRVLRIVEYKSYKDNKTTILYNWDYDRVHNTMVASIRHSLRRLGEFLHRRYNIKIRVTREWIKHSAHVPQRPIAGVVGKPVLKSQPSPSKERIS